MISIEVKRTLRQLKSSCPAGDHLKEGGPLSPKEGSNWHDHMRVVINKVTVEIAESKKNLNISNRTRNCRIGDGGYISRIYGNTILRDDKSQKADFLDMEFTFFELDK